MGAEKPLDAERVANVCGALCLKKPLHFAYGCMTKEAKWDGHGYKPQRGDIYQPAVEAFCERLLLAGCCSPRKSPEIYRALKGRYISVAQQAALYP